LQYAFSNEGLKKLCKQFEILMPDNGYWMKLKFNKEIEKPKFNPHFDGENKTILIIQEDGNLVNINQSPLTIRTKEILSDAKSPLIVPERLSNPDILIQNTITFHDKRKNDHYYRHEKIDTVSIYVFPDNYSRALRIMDTFIKLIRYSGHSFKRDINKRGPRIVVNDVEFHFEIRESLPINLWIIYLHSNRYFNYKNWGKL
jgi:hypothetical protein